ncbi:MAG: hypothetical protein AAF236_02070 [Verrucomicrobiota bacterium]
MKNWIPIRAVKTVIVASLAFSSAGFAENEPAESDPYVAGGWEKLTEFDDPEKIVRETGSVDPVDVLRIEEPGVKKSRHLLAGEVRYSDVQGDGFLEMWTVYKEGKGETAAGRYFSRTLGMVGPMAKITGSSEWRQFMLPFNGRAGMYPDELEFNVVLPGGGEVELRGLALYQQGDQSDAAWMLPDDAEIGFTIAAVVSLGFAGLAGGFTWFTIQRRLTLGIFLGLFAIGILSALIGLIALALSQPIHVWRGLLLLGGLCCFLGLIGGAVARMVFTQRELRAIEAAA